VECELGLKLSSTGSGARDAVRVGAAEGELLLVCETANTEHWVRALRAAASAAPIVVLSRAADSSAAAACREAGADEFVRLPSEPCALKAHLAELSRRVAGAPAKESGKRVRIALDATTCSVCVGSFRATLRPTSFELFAYLSARQGHWVKSEELREHVLSAASPHGSHVRWHVLEARARLGPMSWWVHGDIRLGFMLSFAPCGRAHCDKSDRSMAE
jgi:DNA-binding response OmpR family regulator